MNVSQITPTSFKHSHALGSAVISHPKGDTDVFFVAPVDKNGEENSLAMQSASYFTSRLLAETNFSDVTTGTKLIDSLTGRTLPEMADFLGKTSR